jgi:hypothetical protein
MDARKARMQAKTPAKIQKPIVTARFRQHQGAAQLREIGVGIGLHGVKPIQPTAQKHNNQPRGTGCLGKGQAHPRQSDTGAQAKQQGATPKGGEMGLAHLR